MSSYLQVVLLLSALCSVQAVYNGRGWWLQQPFTEDNEFTLLAEYGKDYLLNCTGDFTVEFWVIPDMTIIEANNKLATYYSVDGSSYTQWQDDGNILNVTLVVEDQFGFYFCHGTDAEGHKRVVKKAINYKGPYFTNTWERYRMNTIIGCSAAAAFFVIACVSYCVYEWKFSDDEDEREENGTTHSPYYTNSAYDVDSAPKVVPGGANAMPMDSTML